MRETPNEVLGVDIPFHPIEGRLVKMEPLMPKHKEEVRAAIDCDPTAWSVLLVNPMGAGFEEYWSANCGAPLTERLPYVIRRLSDGQVVGVSTYFTAKAKHGGVEIGATFLRPDVRASFVNPETKMLMLGHAFNSGAVRVQFTVDVRNERSQAAVAKLGSVDISVDLLLTPWEAALGATVPVETPHCGATSICCAAGSGPRRQSS